jgi:poly-gamma-glutamate synthesis protein (capsule biosynthesis protein)
MTTTVLLTGNTFFVTQLSRYRMPGFVRLVERLRAADVTIANLECTLPDADTPPAFVAGSGWGATSMAGEPWLADELRALGIDAVTAGNNHTADFGELGVLQTVRRLDGAGLAHAGIGASLEEATAPAFVDAPSGARVALISASDWGPRGAMGLGMPWPMGHLASDESPPLRSRPGLNLLRYEAVTHVRSDDLATLKRLSAELDWDDDKVSRRNGGARSHPLVGMETNIGIEHDTDESVWFLGRRFVLGDAPGVSTAPCEADVVRMERAVRHARRQADVVLVALHDQSHGDTVHDYVRTFAERMIDAGADVYFNNGGTHKGVAMHAGRPIIYGVPTFLLQTETTKVVPAEAQARFGLRGVTSSEYIDARAAGVGAAARPRGPGEPRRAPPRGMAGGRS